MPFFKNTIYSLVISVVVATSFFPIACEKEELTLHTDTIFPLPYFPAYPGSYWTYMYVDYNDTFYRTNVVEPSYELRSYKGIADPVYVPIFYGLGVFGYDYEGGGKILSDKVGDGIDSWSDAKGGNYTIVEDLFTDTILFGNHYDSVLYIINYGYVGSNEVESIRYYYAKNIGRIASANNIDEFNVAHTVSQIVDYHINK